MRLGVSHERIEVLLLLLPQFEPFWLYLRKLHFTFPKKVTTLISLFMTQISTFPSKRNIPILRKSESSLLKVTDGRKWQQSMKNQFSQAQEPSVAKFVYAKAILAIFYESEESQFLETRKICFKKEGTSLTPVDLTPTVVANESWTTNVFES